jgi:hypothetical protein
MKHLPLSEGSILAHTLATLFGRPLLLFGASPSSVGTFTGIVVGLGAVLVLPILDILAVL